MTMTGRRFFLLCCLLCVLCASVVNSSSSAHPVGERCYDRTIIVRLDASAVVVEYELEVNTATVAQDLADLGEEIDLSQCRKPSDYYEAFVQFHAPVFARNFDAKLDGKPLTFTCARREFGVREKVSLHCHFVFRAPWQPAPGRSHAFTFREGNYEQQAGHIRLLMTDSDSITPTEVNTPPAQLQLKPLTLLGPGEADRLREASASFSLTAAKEPAGAAAEEPAPMKVPPEQPEASVWGVSSLGELLLHRGEALWLLAAVAAFLGAAHALTPGHGKTLVAAYLVGERGTVGHALYLGLVTTLSHTGAIIAIAVAVDAFCGGRIPPALQPTLGLCGGLLVTGMGAWLLLARLTGRADHVHVFGGHHHHHGHEHGHADHSHEHIGWGRLTLLGVAGGIVPCHDAIWLYVWLVGAGLLAFAVPVLLAFSAGLAAVLVAIGIVVVKAKGLAGGRWGESRAFRALPIVSAALVLCVGLWLCYHSLPTVPGR
jgi:ABC-type nickel/cobalt efflux system permease component RcnA